MEIPIEYLISICFILSFFLALSLVGSNVYALQQGGLGTGGSATSGSDLAGSANCYGTCILNGPPAIGGSGTGGNAEGPDHKDSGNNQSASSQLSNNSIVSSTTLKN